MTLEQARLFAATLTAAANRAEAEGRSTLTESDLQAFAAADDAARAELELAIANAKIDN